MKYLTRLLTSLSTLLESVTVISPVLESMLKGTVELAKLNENAPPSGSLA